MKFFHLSCFFVLSFYLPKQALAYQVGVVKVPQAIVYADPERKAPIGFLKKGKQLILNNEPKYYDSSLAFDLNGKLAWLQIIDLEVYPDLAAFQRVHGKKLESDGPIPYSADLDSKNFGPNGESSFGGADTARSESQDLKQTLENERYGKLKAVRVQGNSSSPGNSWASLIEKIEAALNGLPEDSIDPQTAKNVTSVAVEILYGPRDALHYSLGGKYSMLSQLAVKYMGIGPSAGISWRLYRNGMFRLGAGGHASLLLSQITIEGVKSSGLSYELTPALDAGLDVTDQFQVKAELGMAMSMWSHHKQAEIGGVQVDPNITNIGYSVGLGLAYKF